MTGQLNSFAAWIISTVLHTCMWLGSRFSATSDNVFY